MTAANLSKVALSTAFVSPSLSLVRLGLGSVHPLLGTMVWDAFAAAMAYRYPPV